MNFKRAFQVVVVLIVLLGMVSYCAMTEPPKPPFGEHWIGPRYH